MSESTSSTISTPLAASLKELCQALSERADATDMRGDWPTEQLSLCADYGVYRWFVSPQQGGLGWDEADLLRGYLQISAACMTTAFILTQATGALRRIADAAEEEVQSQWLPNLLSGARFTTLGISHLTTSRRHMARPALQASEADGGFVLDGFSPWVTGGIHADGIVTGAQLADGRQILVLLPTELPGVSSDEPARLVGLSASHTGAVRLAKVRLPMRYLLDGPEENVVSGATGAKTGGLQTSALALGLAARAIGFVESESAKRLDLAPPAESLQEEQTELQSDLLALASGEQVCSNEELRARSNSLALRAAQAALAAAKGTGYVTGHPAGRWCREALFFLVWSCPQPVMAANLCELAGIEG